HAPNEGESEQGVLVGCIDATLRMMGPNGTEIVTGIVVTPAFGGIGWMTGYEMTFEYSSRATITVSFVAADQNNSIIPNPITLPSTGGEITKRTTKISPNKWQLMQVKFQSTDPAM